MKGLMLFRKKGNLIPGYIFLYLVLNKASKVAYKLELPPSLSSIYPMIYVSTLRKCMVDPSTVIPFKEVDISDYL